MKKRFALRAFLLLLVGVVALGDKNSLAGNAGTEVKIDNFSFIPPTITVKAGTPVTWINKDNTPYTLVSPTGGPLNSSSIPPGGAWWFTFPNVGSFDYELQSDPNVKGNVTVKLPGQ